MVSYEYISMACYTGITDRNTHKLAGERAEECEGFYFYDKKTGETIPDELALEVILSTGTPPWIEKSGCEITDDMLVSAALLHGYGHKEQAKKMLKHALYILWQHKTEDTRLKKLEEVFKSSRQKTIAKKPRNKHYDEVMRIAKDTWEKYPAASKGQMCENLSKHFNGGVSADRIDIWIKNSGIQPPKPQKYTSFALVT